MSIVVVGTGRSGTNLTLELLAGSPSLKASEPAENKRMFKQLVTYSDNYLTKCDTCYIDDVGALDRFYTRNPSLKFVYTVRDPRDMAMSKLRRGAPKSEGGDCASLADDATPEGCVKDILRAKEIYEFLNTYHSQRTFLVRMEDVLRDPDDAARNLSAFAGIKYSKEMQNFPTRMRLPTKRARYKTVDKGQISLYKYWEDYEDGFLKKFDMPTIFNELAPLTEYFGYGS